MMLSILYSAIIVFIINDIALILRHNILKNIFFGKINIVDAFNNSIITYKDIFLLVVYSVLYPIWLCLGLIYDESNIIFYIFQVVLIFFNININGIIMNIYFRILINLIFFINLYFLHIIY